MLNNKSEVKNNGNDQNNPYIEMKGVTRDFGYIRALNNVNF